MAVTSNTNYYVATSGGNDANDGADLLGFDLTTASYIDNLRTVIQSGKFEFYSFTPGDKIYMSHASMTDGLQEIEDRVDNDTIRLVTAIGVTMFVVTSSDGPLDTLAQAEIAVVAGGEVYLSVTNSGEVFDEGGEPGDWPVTIDVGGSQADGMIKWSGCNSQGTVDGTLAILDASAGSGDCLNVEASANRIFFQYISCENATTFGWDLNSTGSTGQARLLYRCEAHNNGSDGFSGTSWSCCLECTSEGNGGDGFHMWITDNWCIGCTAVNNADRGFYGRTAGRLVCLYCSAYNTSGVTSQNLGISTAHLSAFCNCHNNVDGGIGVVGDQATFGIAIDCILTDNGSGIDANGIPLLALNNGFHNNTSQFANDSNVLKRDNITLSESPHSRPDENDFTLTRSLGGAQCFQAYDKNWTKLQRRIEGFDGTFTTSEGWTEGSGWTIDGGVATTSGTDSFLSTDDILTPGVYYDCIYTVVTFSAGGNILLVLGGQGGRDRSSTGTFREIIQCLGTGVIFFDPSTAAVEASIDDFIITPVSGTNMTSYRPIGISNLSERRWAK